MIDFGIASECTDDDCEGRLVLDGVCTWCGKEYPKEIDKRIKQRGEAVLELLRGVVREEVSNYPPILDSIESAYQTEFGNG